MARSSISRKCLKINIDVDSGKKCLDLFLELPYQIYLFTSIFNELNQKFHG